MTLGSTDQALFRLAGAGAVQPPSWLWDSIRRICFPALATAVSKSVGTESVGITRREGQSKSVVSVLQSTPASEQPHSLEKQPLLGIFQQCG